MIKRLLDFTASALGLVILSPVFLLLALLIKFHDGGPVFFAQRRMGRGGKSFRMLKFRSMIVDAAQKGPQLTVGADRRITPVGRVLRATKLDELPQLWNVMRGEMSLVGPRPEVEAYVRLYTEEQQRVLHLKPGITDPASFAFFDESKLLAQAADPERFYREQLMGEKIRINLEYARRANVITDVILILATIVKAFGLHADIFKWFKIRAPSLEL
jgi:lipopolysaccharide/colanic/teichoic acid biosynthesis glycosyltransferase